MTADDVSNPLVFMNGRLRMGPPFLIQQTQNVEYAAGPVVTALTTTIYFRSAMCVKDGDLASGLYRG